MAEEKGDLEDAVEKVVKKKGKGGWSDLIQKGIAAALVAFLTWLGSCVSKEYETLKSDHEAIAKRLATLEQDQAKWATLADLQDQQHQMKTQLEILRQVWSYEYGRKVPTGFPSKEGEPDLKPSADLLRDIERYKNMQEQRVQKK
jgi:hypothetical protein